MRTFCGLEHKVRLKRWLRVWRLVVRDTSPEDSLVARTNTPGTDHDSPSRRLMSGESSWGRKFANIFFFSSDVRGRRTVTREHDLCTPMKSRITTSGKRNWSWYAPCEKATEINEHACAREIGGKTSNKLPRITIETSTGKTAMILSLKIKSLREIEN